MFSSGRNERRGSRGLDRQAKEDRREPSETRLWVIVQPMDLRPGLRDDLVHAVYAHPWTALLRMVLVGVLSAVALLVLIGLAFFDSWLTRILH